MIKKQLGLAALFTLTGLQFAVAQFNVSNIYPIETSHSYMEFSITYMGYAEVRGGFGDFGGTIVYDEQNPEHTSVTFRVGVESIDSGNDWRNRDLKSPGWFAAEEYPEITFQSSSAAVDGDQLLVTGDLTIKDVTKTITVTLAKPQGVLVDNRDDHFVMFKGSYTLNRKEYHVMGERWDKVKAGIASLSNDVTVQFSLLGKQIKEGNFSNWLRNPRSPQHHIYQAYNDKGMDGALAQFELMKDTMDINSAALNIVGYMLLKKDLVSDAVKIFESNVEAFPEDSNAHDSLGEALIYASREEDAKRVLEKAVTLDPKNTQAKELLRHL